MDPKQLAEHHNSLIATFIDYSNRPGYENYLAGVSNDIEIIRRDLAQVADFRLDQQGYIVEMIPIAQPAYNGGYNSYGNNGYQPRPQQSYNRPNNNYNYNRPETRPSSNEESRYGKLANKVDMSPKQPVYSKIKEIVPEEKIFITGHKYPLLVSDDKVCKEDDLGNNLWQYIVENNGTVSDLIKNTDVGLIEDETELDAIYTKVETNSIIGAMRRGYINIKTFIDDEELERISDVEDLNYLDLSLLKLNKSLASYNFYKNHFTRLFNFLCKVKLVKRTLSSDDILNDIDDIDRDLIKANSLPDSTTAITKIRNILIKNIAESGIFSDKDYSFIRLPIVFIPNKYNRILEERLLKQKHKSEIYKISELSSEDFYNISKSTHTNKLMEEYGFICLAYKNVDGLFRYRLVTKSEIDTDFFITRNSYYI